MEYLEFMFSTTGRSALSAALLILFTYGIFGVINLIIKVPLIWKHGWESRKENK